MPQKLKDIFDALNSDLAIAIKNCRRLSLWNRVVDERVQKMTEAVKIRNRILYVSTSSSAWASELTFMKQAFIKKFNLLAGEEAIFDIRFKTAGLETQVGGK